MAKLIRVRQDVVADTCEVLPYEIPSASQLKAFPALDPDPAPDLTAIPCPDLSTDSTVKAISAGRQVRLRPAGRHGRHARGFDSRPSRRAPLSIRSAEGRHWSGDLNGPGPASLVVYGVGGIGKSTLATQIAARVSRVRSEHVVTTLSGELSAASFAAEPTATDFVILDNFDDNLSQHADHWTVRDPAVAMLLATWPGKLLIVCRRPFTLVSPDGADAAATLVAGHASIPRARDPFGIPEQRTAFAPLDLPPLDLPPLDLPLLDPPRPGLPGPGGARQAGPRIVFRQLGPLTRSGAWELASSLPAIRLLLDSERDQVWRLTAGHPLAMEYLDALLALGTRYTEVAGRIEAAIQARNGQPLPRTEPTEWPEATATLVASAVGDLLAGELLARLSAGARALLVRASVFRLPVAPDVLAARPGQIAEAQSAALLAVGPDADLSVHRWTADALHRLLAEAGLGGEVASAHHQAAAYWRTLAAAKSPTHARHRAELEAAYHDRHGTETRPAEQAVRRDFGPAAITRRRRVIRIGVVGAIAAAAALLAVEATQSFDVPHLAAADGPAATPAATVTQAATVRAQAAAWAAQQVSGSAIMACDPAMCSVLVRHGVAAANLLVLGPGAGDPLGSDVVLATAAVRGMFGGRLTSVYAPEVLASFGSGQTRIDVRMVAPDGATAYRAALAADRRDRQVAGAQLLRDPRMTFAASARAQLAAGLVDARLLITLDTLAASEPIRIEAFAGDSPGAGPGEPLRAAEITAAASSAQNMLAFFRAQRPPYLPARVAVTAAGDGQSLLTVQFAAPALFGLLKPPA